ncbi:hypothetical protein ACFVH6_23565 [Spirillospora sp. NPDC127200]
MDLKRTKNIDPRGVTVALHTDTRFIQDLDESGMIYRYPDTARRSGHDAQEVAAMKAAAELGLPLFVITPPHRRRRCGRSGSGGSPTVTMPAAPS